MLEHHEIDRFPNLLPLPVILTQVKFPRATFLENIGFFFSSLVFGKIWSQSVQFSVVGLVFVITSRTQEAGMLAGTIWSNGRGPMDTIQSCLVELAACSIISNQLLLWPEIPVLNLNQSSAVKFP